MARFALFVPPHSGHINPMSALVRALKGRGHEVIAFNIADTVELLKGIDFVQVGAEAFPRGRMAELDAQLGSMSGLAAARFTLDMICMRAEAFVKDAPDAIRAARCDALIADQAELFAGSIAEHLGIPYVTICNAVPADDEPNLPPIFVDWAYPQTAGARFKVRLARWIFERSTRGLRAKMNELRERLSLAPIDVRQLNALAQAKATIAQVPRELDFPRLAPPTPLHHVGPFVSESAAVPFPYARLNGKPLIYASLGTLQNRQPALFATIARACAGLDAQLVITTGGGIRAEALGALPGDPIVVDYAPQRELLARATLAVTAAGLNTVLDALGAGVPLVALPIANDQAGNAGRLRNSGAAEILPFAKLNEKRLALLVRKVLSDERYRMRARAIQAAIARSGGAPAAAELIEALLARPLADSGPVRAKAGAH